MKFKPILVLLLLVFVAAACSAEVSPSDLQTAVAQVRLTAIASITPAPQLQIAQSVSADEFEQMQAQLEQSKLTLTEQAQQIASLQDQLEQLQITLTPTSIPTLTSTSTPVLTSTPSIPEDQKVVVALKKAPLYYFNSKNDAGYPIMAKTQPVIFYQQGEWLLVYKAVTRADGKTYFYKVVGPHSGGKYVRVGDVQDQ